LTLHHDCFILIPMYSLKTIFRPFLIYSIFFSTFLLCSDYSIAEDAEKANISEFSPNKFGIGMTAGQTYNPVNDITFLQLNLFGIFDYKKVWEHPAPKALRFKVEYNIGTTVSSPQRFIVSANIFAMRYIDLFSTKHIRPYVEGGIGAIYTDFKVQGQGLRFNFNPQAGAGIEFLVNSKPAFYISVRAHHLSNGEIAHRENRGINSVVLSAGKMF
jgi:lipid A 3-O-deacylase